MTPGTRSGRVSFIGAGPGAADLITLRGARHIAEADIVVWAASLVTPECIHEHARTDAELVDSSRLTHEDAVEIYRRAEREWLKVARVHSGDPSLWGAVQEQHDVCSRMELEVEIVPGVAAFSAAAASAGRELTVPEVAQSVVLTRLEGGKTPMPSGEKVRRFAEHGTTMALFLSAARTGQLVEELRAGGYTDDVPVLVAYKVTWPDELMLRTTLGELETAVKQHKLWRHTLFLVGWALTEGGTRSHLYNPGHFHTFRRADPQARKALRAQRGRSTRFGPSSQNGERQGSSGASTGSALAEPEPARSSEPERTPNQPDPDVAWWAVRDWQQTARDAARSASARREDAAADQHDLFADGGADSEPRSAAPAASAEQPAVELTVVPDSEPATATGAAGDSATAVESSHAPEGRPETPALRVETPTAQPEAPLAQPEIPDETSESTVGETRGKARTGNGTAKSGGKGTRRSGSKSGGSKTRSAKSGDTEQAAKSGSGNGSRASSARSDAQRGSAQGGASEQSGEG